MPHVQDPLDLPEKWFCHMNPDKRNNNCSNPQDMIEDEEFLIKNLYNAGSVVWGRVEGYPWWPALVEDDPDIENYFWLEENIEEPVSTKLFLINKSCYFFILDLLPCYIF